MIGATRGLIEAWLRFAGFFGQGWLNGQVSKK